MVIKYKYIENGNAHGKKDKEGAGNYSKSNIQTHLYTEKIYMGHDSKWFLW